MMRSKGLCISVVSAILLGRLKNQVTTSIEPNDTTTIRDLSTTGLIDTTTRPTNTTIGMIIHLILTHFKSFIF